MFNGFDLSTIQDAKFGNSQVSSIYYGANLIWPTTPPPPPHDYSQDYLTIVSLSNNNTITWKAGTTHVNHDITPKNIQYSLDDGQTWTTVTSSYAGATIATINNGEKILLRGSNNTYGHRYINTSYNYDTWNTILSTNFMDVCGNIMSLIYSDQYTSNTSFNNIKFVFWHLFENNNKLVNANNLVLPATTATGACYTAMFRYCTSLTTAPKLPATTLDGSSYESMFSNCASLTTSPELPATTLANNCYHDMFYNCTTLTAAPELPATTLTNYCYQTMFYGCTNLNYIKCLATDISATDCTASWVTGVAATGDFYKDANTTWTTGRHGIPSGWTVINI